MAEATDDITMYDQNGREVKIPRKEWVEQVLPENIRRAWDNPEALYALLVAAMKENLAASVQDAAHRLTEIDPIPERSAVIQGIILIQSGKPAEAEQLFQAYIQQHGETGAILTNLAKIQYERGEQEPAEKTLRRALALDPNMDNALGWYAAVHRQRGGEDEALKALREIAAEPQSWRAQLWIARELLKKDKFDEAISLYRQVLAERPVPGDGLMQISGDLGNAGKIEEMIDLMLPVYNLEFHGPYAGLNLLQGLIQTNHLGDALGLLQKLQALKNPAMTNYLSDAASRLAKAAAARQQEPVANSDERVQVAAVPLLNPVWTAALSKPEWLLPALRADAIRIAIFSLADGTRSTDQPSDTENDTGRLTRALPLYLAEALRVGSDAATACIIPVIPRMGPIVTNAPWPLPHMLGACPEDFQPDFVICGALTRGARGAKVELHVFRAKDKTALKTIRVPAAEDFSGTAARAAQDLLTFLTTVGVNPTAPGIFSPPAAIEQYLACLARLFSQTLAASGIIDPARLANEQITLDGYFALAEQGGDAPVSLLVAAAGVTAALRYRSPLAPHYRQRLLDLLKSGAARHNVIRQAAPAIYRRLGDTEAFEAARAASTPEDGELYTAWLSSLAEQA